MTFEAARCEHLRALDALYFELRTLVADPSFTDRKSQLFCSVMDRFKETIEKLRRVNRSEYDLCSNPDPEPTPLEADNNG